MKTTFITPSYSSAALPGSLSLLVLFPAEARAGFSLSGPSGGLGAGGPSVGTRAANKFERKTRDSHLISQNTWVAYSRRLCLQGGMAIEYHRILG